MHVTKHRALALFTVLALAACSGKDGTVGAKGDAGANGVNGTNGTNGVDGTDGVDGTNGTNGVSGVPGKLSLTMDGVVTTTATDGKKTATLTFTLRPAATFCPGAVCNDTLSTAGTKTLYASYYDAASNSFTTAKTFSFSNIHFKGFTADGNGAQYTATNTNAPIEVENSTSAFVYGYVTTAAAFAAPTSGHYLLPTMVASAAKVYGTVPYTSNAIVSGCEKCHGAPYSKHGYRQAKVAGLNDFVSCKACHTDQRPGSDADWFMKADDPANYPADGMTADQKAKYAYTANLMNDTHNSHALEFNYPQSMANCVTCHAGKLDNILTDANFRPTVCKSCHVVTGPSVGVEGGRAPALKTILKNKGFDVLHSAIDWDAITAGGVDASPTTCNICHSAGSIAKTFKQLHAGYNKSIYADATGTRYADSIKVTVGTTAYDATTKILTVPFTVSGTAANALVAPTLVLALYGYDTKDFVVSGHSTWATTATPAGDGKRVAEFAYGSTSNAARLSLSPATLTAGTTTFTATADLTVPLSLVPAGVAAPTRVQVNILPVLGLDQTKAVDTKEYVLSGTTTACGTVPATGCAANPNYNPPIAITGATVAIDLAGANAGKVNAKPYGNNIADGAKCNACHDALGTTFHSPSYGSAGPVACRVCHTVQNAGSHLEMQSRSIDSYVHAIHQMQAFDISGIDMTDAVAKIRYEDKVDGNYPNFAGTLNCESCHNKGTYDVPDQTKSLPGIISKSSKFAAGTRAIPPDTIPAQITGPAERACGGCHRAKFINEDDVTGLQEFYQHATMAGISVNSSTTADLGNVTAYVMGLLGVGPVTPYTGTAGTVQVEGCAICHATAGSDHQKLFNVWKSGL